VEELEGLRQRLEDEAVQASKGAGMRQLRQILKRLAKGEIGLRLEIWGQEKKRSAHAAHAAMRASLELQMKANSQEAGLRQLRQIMARMARGELGMRKEVWWTAMKDEQRQLELAAQQAALETKAASESCGAGLRQLRQIMARMVRGELGMRIDRSLYSHIRY